MVYSSSSPQSAQTVRVARRPTRNTVRIASKSLNRTYKGIPRSWREHGGTIPSPQSPSGRTVTSRELSDSLERLDGLPPVYSGRSAPASRSLSTAENIRPRISMKTPTKSPSRIMLRTMKSKDVTPEREALTSSTNTTRFSRNKQFTPDSTPTKTSTLRQKREFTVTPKPFKDGNNLTRTPQQRAVATTYKRRSGIPDLMEDSLYYFPYLLDEPRPGYIHMEPYDSMIHEYRIKKTLWESGCPLRFSNPPRIERTSCETDPAKILYDPVPSKKPCFETRSIWKRSLENPEYEARTVSSVFSPVQPGLDTRHGPGIPNEAARPAPLQIVQRERIVVAPALPYHENHENREPIFYSVSFVTGSDAKPTVWTAGNIEEAIATSRIIPSHHGVPAANELHGPKLLFKEPDETIPPLKVPSLVLRDDNHLRGRSFISEDDDVSMYDVTPQGSRNITPITAFAIRGARAGVSVKPAPTQTDEKKERFKSSGTQKLNPLAKEFSTLGKDASPANELTVLKKRRAALSMRSEPIASKPATSRPKRRETRSEDVPKSSRSGALLASDSSKAREVVSEPEYMEIEDMLKTATEPVYMKISDLPKKTCTLPFRPIKALVPGEKRTDNMEDPGRVAYVMEPALANKQLEDFMRKYPMTGKRRVAAPPAPTVKGKQAAVVQQRIEFLLMQQKEKQAFEALQKQMKEMEEVVMG